MAHSGCTPEPWEWDQTGYADVEVFRDDPDATDDGDGVEVIAEVAYYGDVDRMTANARRIVACVNACQGIPTEALEAGVARDLLEALEAAAPILQRFLSAGPATVQVDERQALRMAQAALRKARSEEVG